MGELFGKCPTRKERGWWFHGQTSSYVGATLVSPFK